MRKASWLGISGKAFVHNHSETTCHIEEKRQQQWTVHEKKRKEKKRKEKKKQTLEIKEDGACWRYSRTVHTRLSFILNITRENTGQQWNGCSKLSLWKYFVEEAEIEFYNCWPKAISIWTSNLILMFNVYSFLSLELWWKYSFHIFLYGIVQCGGGCYVQI